VNDIFDKTDDYYHHYKIVNIKDTNRQIKGLELIFIELPKFTPSETESRAEKKMRELWLRYLTEIDEDTKVVPAELLENSLTKKAVSFIEEFMYSDDERYLYENVWDAVMKERTLLYEALEKGREEGREEIIKKLLSSGISLDKAAEITGLATQDIVKITKT
jgi:predicted transposase/invertase (TIGR01784 family)